MAAAVVKQCQEESTEDTPYELHPLQDSWSYYVYLYKSNGLWDECLNKVSTFSTIEQFWGVMLHTIPPSTHAYGTDVYMFRSDIQPSWEDPKNESGGRWLLNLSPTSPVDTYWEELLILLIGCDWETDEQAEQICGAVFQPRARGHKMAVWLSNGEDKDSILQIGTRIKERLNFPDQIYFQTVTEQKSLGRGKDITSGTYVL
ncbi:hypothetical protein CRM22_002422 [Opisthorchis felineus]|uniref:Eukaryotic initiation factor 4E n=3 Tax=Opisthorchis TaxID=6197 RepID=A0A075AIW9_OPIVI|nr:hypothetical protein T265_01587 [Opisthorchis viverrini]KER32364.1 hypothetical protein T265_01587 [Opisthorchis viverrini]TGZ71847.1 hypothetical protein CRM22_002422 [Opisthorchis felineus]